MLVLIFLINMKSLTIPANGIFRELISHSLVAMRMTCNRVIRKIHYEIVRNIHSFPVLVIKLITIRTCIMNRISFCKIVEILCTTSKILCRVSSITEMELPSLIKIDKGTLSHCRHIGKG